MDKLTPQTLKRLQNEFKQVSTNPVANSTVLLENENDVTKWTVIMLGPKDTPYEGGNFKISFVFPDNYPFKPPDCKFVTPIYHPNIKMDTGEICQDIYASSWAPTQKVADILMLLSSMMSQPQTTSPLEPDICKEFLENRAEFEKKARDSTLKNATG